jgi:hypothetical protein
LEDGKSFEAAPKELLGPDDRASTVSVQITNRRKPTHSAGNGVSSRNSGMRDPEWEPLVVERCMAPSDVPEGATLDTEPGSEPEPGIERGRVSGIAKGTN